MIQGLDHVGLAVPDLDRATAFFRDVLGLRFAGFEELPERHLRVALFDLGGARLELLQPTSPEAAVSRFLERTGGGIHHLAFRVDDAAAELARLEKAGVEPIDRAPRPGLPGERVAFLDPKSTFRILVELCEARQD